MICFREKELVKMKHRIKKFAAFIIISPSPIGVGNESINRAIAHLRLFS